MEKARGRDSKQENFRWDSRVSDEKRFVTEAVGKEGKRERERKRARRGDTVIGTVAMPRLKIYVFNLTPNDQLSSRKKSTRGDISIAR